MKDAVLSTHQQYNLTTCRYDPYQAELMAQQLSREDVPMEELPFVGKNLNVMASTLLDAFRSGRLDLYRDDALMRDLSRLTIVQRSFGFKLEASRDSKGHADRGIAHESDVLSQERSRPVPFLGPRSRKNAVVSISPETLLQQQ